MTKELSNREQFKLSLVSPEQIIPELEPVAINAQYKQEIMGQNYEGDFAKVLSTIYSKPNNTYEVRAQSFLNMLKGQIIVDIGAGTTSSGYCLAQQVGAKAYIAVEPHNYDELRHNLTFMSLDSQPIPAAVVNEDALGFLSRVPAGSVSIVISGLDEQVLSPRQFPQIHEYKKQVIGQIIRILKQNNVYINYDSWLIVDERESEVNGLLYDMVEVRNLPLSICHRK